MPREFGHVENYAFFAQTKQHNMYKYCFEASLFQYRQYKMDTDHTLWNMGVELLAYIKDMC